MRVEINGSSCLKQGKTDFTSKNVEKLFIVYESHTWSRDSNLDFTLKDCLFDAVNLATNPDPDKYSCSGYGIGFDSRSLFSLSSYGWGKSVQHKDYMISR